MSNKTYHVIVHARYSMLHTINARSEEEAKAEAIRRERDQENDDAECIECERTAEIEE